MKLTSDDETLAENKVLILYVLNKIGKPVSNDELLNAVLAVTDINYFYFQQFLLDLLEKKYIISYEKDNHNIYEINSNGKNVLELTGNIIPGILKLKVDNTVKTEVNNFANEHSVIAEFTPKDNNNFDVSCKIIENNDTIFEVKTSASSLVSAKSIINNWQEHADEIYPKIIEIISTTNNDK